MKKPNVIIVFADQWRAQAFGYAGNDQVKTPNIDQLAARSTNFRNAIASTPVCTPYRASLLTGQYPLTHGLFLNDAKLSDDAVSIAQAFAVDGYDTAYVGKWHVDGHGRGNYIPPERRKGFDYWKVLECTHDYNESFYYDHDCEAKKTWDGYDAIAQTRDVQQYLVDHQDAETRFFLILSWGPPHNPYGTAPQKYRDMYQAAQIKLRPNVPNELSLTARDELAGYYAHCTALDECMGDLIQTLETTGQMDDTILLFTSDHGDMIQSQGQQRKQKPWSESVRVPFLVSYPAVLGNDGQELDGFIDAPDIMPTLLGMAGVAIPETVEGRDFSAYTRGEAGDPSEGVGLVACYHPFGEFERGNGGREYRGILTGRYTYAEALDGPWLLYDNQVDPYQLRNLVDDPSAEIVMNELRTRLRDRLDRMGDDFNCGDHYVEQWGYPVNERGTLPTC